MKLFLPKLTAAAMVATASSANALQWPSWAALRSSDNYAKVESDCEDGYAAGVKETKDLWKKGPNNSNCDNIWDFDDQADDMKHNKFPENPSNWRDETYNQCARNGVDDEVNNIEKECTWDDTSQCNDLGNAAAEKIVMREWCTPGSSSYSHGNTNWKAECAAAAVDICKGNIANVANRWCPDEKMNGGELNGMKAQCQDEVDSMVGNDNRRPPTRSPTRKPKANKVAWQY